MNYIDILLIIPLIYAAYKGFTKGFIIEIFTLLALLVGLYAGIHFSEGTANFLKESWNFNSKFLPIISFALTFLAVGAMVYFAGKMLEKVVDVINLTFLNKALGVLFSLIKTAYILSIILVLIEAYDNRSDIIDDATQNNSMLYQPIKNLSIKTIPGIEESSLRVADGIYDTKENSEELF